MSLSRKFSTLVSSALCLFVSTFVVTLLPSQAGAATIAYWQFDNATTGDLTGSGLADSVGSYDLTLTGNIDSSAVAAVNPVPNPDTTVGFSGDPSANPDAGFRPSLFSVGLTNLDRLTVTTDPGNVFNLSGKSFTFEGWFQHADNTISSGFGDIIGGTRDAGPFGGYVLRMLPDGSISAFFAEAGGAADTFDFGTSGMDYRGAPEEFHHFALTWQDGAGANSTGFAQIYIDGLLEASASAPAAFSAAIADSNDDAFIIAGRSAANSNNWDGRLDEFRFSDTVLLPSQFLNASVPEPSTVVLIGLGIVAGACGRFRAR